MALAISVRVGFIDAKGRTSFTTVRLPTGFTLSDYAEAGQAIAQLMTDISLARVTSCSVVVPVDLSTATLRAVAANASDIFQKMYAQFSSAVAGFRARFKLPTFDETLSPVGTDQVDQSDPDVAALLTAMTSGISVTGGTIQPVDNRSQDLVSVDTVKKVFRNK